MSDARIFGRYRALNPADCSWNLLVVKLQALRKPPGVSLSPDHFLLARIARQQAQFATMRGGAWLAASAILALASVAQSRPHVRKHFEPTNLEFEEPGTTELDLETGFVRSQDAWRLVAPDFELDLGLTSWLELGIDGAYAFEGKPGAPFSFDHAAPDPLWPALKVGFLDIEDNESGRTYALGAQVGPKLPTFPGGRGLGIEGVLLAGAHLGFNDFGLNLGGFVDPRPQDAPRPSGFEASLAWERDLDAKGTWSLGGEVGSVVFTSSDPTQLQAAFGPSYAAASWLDLSVTGLLGFLPGGDRYGLLLGFAPHLPLWKQQKTE